LNELGLSVAKLRLEPLCLALQLEQLEVACSALHWELEKHLTHLLCLSPHPPALPEHLNESSHDSPYFFLVRRHVFNRFRDWIDALWVDFWLLLLACSRWPIVHCRQVSPWTKVIAHVEYRIVLVEAKLCFNNLLLNHLLLLLFCLFLLYRFFLLLFFLLRPPLLVFFNLPPLLCLSLRPFLVLLLQVLDLLQPSSLPLSLLLDLRQLVVSPLDVDLLQEPDSALQQVPVGGCFVEGVHGVVAPDEFRVEGFPALCGCVLDHDCKTGFCS
jgi:hypothetical protein